MATNIRGWPTLWPCPVGNTLLLLHICNASHLPFVNLWVCRVLIVHPKCSLPDVDSTVDFHQQFMWHCKTKVWTWNRHSFFWATDMTGVFISCECTSFNISVLTYLKVLFVIFVNFWGVFMFYILYVKALDVAKCCNTKKNCPLYVLRQFCAFLLIDWTATPQSL